MTARFIDTRARAPLALAALLLAGCPGSLDASYDADGGAAPRHGGTAPACADVPALFVASCASAGCHAASGSAAGLDLASPDPGGRLAGKPSSQGGPLLDPSSPKTSALYTKLGASPPFGSRMPLGGAPLDEPTMACVSAWIAGQSASGGAEPNADDAGAPSGTPASDGGTPPAPSGFTPGDLASTVVWLDGDRGVTTAGARVSAWSDRSSAHNDAKQDTDGNRPVVAAAKINGHAALTFEEGRETFLQIADGDSLRWGKGGFAVAIVAADRKATAGRKHGGGVSTVFAKPQQGSAVEIAFHLNWFTGESTDDDGNIHIGIGEGLPGLETTGVTANDGNVRVYAARLLPNGGGTDYEVFIDGASKGKMHANDTTDISLNGSPVRIGSTYGQSVEGDIAEVVAMKGAVADSDLSKVTQYLMSKYGVSP